MPEEDPLPHEGNQSGTQEGKDAYGQQNFYEGIALVSQGSKVQSSNPRHQFSQARHSKFKTRFPRDAKRARPCRTR